MKKISPKTYHLLFVASVAAKGVVTAFEIILGGLFYLVNGETLNGILFYFVGAEMAEDPHGLVARYVVHGVQGFIGDAQSFWAFIFLSHGLVKIFLVFALLKNKLWAYPAAAAIFGLFAVYQTYTLLYAPSLFLAAFTFFDVLIIALILHEYRIRRRA